MPDPTPKAPSPATPSSDYSAMLPYWTMVEAIMGGAPAIKKGGQAYLPKFPNESANDYEYRLQNAKFTNIYRDIVENLAAKPFSKEAALKDGTASSSLTELVADIDGQGNNLHVFSSRVFFDGINNAVDWILVDKTPVPDGASRATEKQMGARPYWVHVPAKRMLAVYAAVIDGKQTIVHARIHEPDTVRDGYAEKVVNRVRVLDRPQLADGTYGPATFTVYEEQRETNSSQPEWVEIDAGRISVGIITLVPFIAGRRLGDSWRFVPPMQDAAYLQIEHYQQETNLKSIKEQAAFPMLAGNGVEPAKNQDGTIAVVPVGPKTVLYAPHSSTGRPGEWTFIEPTAESLTFLAKDVENTEQQLRELGRQPLTAQTGNLTVITTAFAAQKANSAIEAWTLNLTDAIDQALSFTALWLGEPDSDPQVRFFADFSVDTESDKAPDFLLSLQKSNVISRTALVTEAKRRGLLSADYDPAADMQEILAQTPADVPENAP